MPSHFATKYLPKMCVCVCVCVTQFLSCTPGEDCVIFTTWLSEYSIHDFITFLKLLYYFWLHTSSSSVYSLCVTRDLSAMHRSTRATLLILALHGHWQSQSVSAKSLSVLDTNYKPDTFFIVDCENKNEVIVWTWIGLERLCSLYRFSYSLWKCICFVTNGRYCKPKKNSEQIRNHILTHY
jgi:hypothetical protein